MSQDWQVNKMLRGWSPLFGTRITISRIRG